jgi:CBS domain-containing protein
MMNVRDVMTTEVITVGPTTPLRDVARVLADNRISGLPVVDEAGSVLGVVSEADFLVKEQGADGIRHRPLARLVGESRTTRARLARLAARTAGEAMSSPAITVAPWMRIAQAAQVMLERRINRLPVVEHGCLVGIVTRADLIRAYVRTDAELAHTIREEILWRTLMLDPATFVVQVEDGVAHVSGAVQRRSSAELIAHAVAMVPGVLDVRTDVSWWLDDSRNEPPPTDPIFP